jgi:4-hydroxybenzoyl-CoA thioesterase
MSFYSGEIMARIKIALPEQFIYQTSMDVRIGDINYGGHMANDAILRLAHEALALAEEHGLQRTGCRGFGIIMADAAVMYRAEAFHGDSLVFNLGTADPTSTGWTSSIRRSMATMAKKWQD